MTLRELAARARLQVALEANSPLLVRELNDDMKLPRSVPRSVWTAPGVVVFQSPSHIGRQTDIETGNRVRVSQDIDNVLVAGHTVDRSNLRPHRMAAE